MKKTLSCNRIRNLYYVTIWFLLFISSSACTKSELNIKEWGQYQEAGTYNGTLTFKDTGSEGASFKVPDDAVKGNTLDIILAVTDNGTPALNRYKRVIITVTPYYCNFYTNYSHNAKIL